MASGRTTAVTAAAAGALALALGPGAVASAGPAGLPGGLPGVCAYTPDLLGTADARFVGLPPAVPPADAPATATLETNLGRITVALDAEGAPCTVNSFRFLAEQGFYAGSECHRMLDAPKAGVLQCGDPTATGRGGPGYEFGDENLAGATYGRGVLAMANHGPDTNGSQFFLVFRPSSFAPAYTPFGRITAGLAVLDAAAAKGTYGPANDRPHTEVVITKVSVP